MKSSNGLAALVAGALAVSPALGAAAPSSLSPQTAGRLAVLGRYAGDAPFCEALGYTLADRDGQAFAQEIAKLADRVGANATEANAQVASAKTRETAELQAAHDGVMANLKDAAGDAALRAYADTLSVRCWRASSDPAATVLMKPPLGAISSLSKRYADKLLTPYGRAGWQTPYALAGGDLAEAVGACEAHKGGSRASLYLKNLRSPDAFAPDINDTVQAWLDARVAKGKAAPQGAAQCAQLLVKRAKALEKAPG